MLEKSAVVRRTPELRAPLDDLKPAGEPPLVLSSRNYYQVGCDLRQPHTLSTALSKIVDVESSRVLWIADASLQYLEPSAADHIIGLAATLARS